MQHSSSSSPTNHMSILLLLLLLVLFQAVNGGGGDMGMDKDELKGLFEVMGSLLEDSSWAQMHPLPCSDTPWPGIECELMEETSIFHVTRIHLANDVTIPPCKTSARISQSILKLSFLKTLSLINCFTELPVFLSRDVFGGLMFLEHLALESNPSLSGEIPSAISNLENLRVLRLSQNNLSGEIPGEIGTLLNLQQLDFSHNMLTGLIPGEIGRLKMLTILDLSWNYLQGMIPEEIGNLQSLEKIDLSSNKLEGTLPGEIGELKKLILLDLSHNLFTGPGPDALSGLQQLQYLIMDDNPLNSSIPLFIGSLTGLRVVSLAGCGLTGPIPIGLSNLKRLTALSLADNGLTGTAPPEIALLPSLDALNLSCNRLAGELAFPPGFMNRLGDRLDVRGNTGLCSIVKSLQVAFCGNVVFPPAAKNKTMAADSESDVKPTLYGSMSSSRKKIVVIPALTSSALLVPFLAVV